MTRDFGLFYLMTASSLEVEFCLDRRTAGTSLFIEVF